MIIILLAVAVIAIVWHRIERYDAAVRAESIRFHNSCADTRRAVREDRIARFAALGRDANGAMVRK